MQMCHYELLTMPCCLKAICKMVYPTQANYDVGMCAGALFWKPLTNIWCGNSCHSKWHAPKTDAAPGVSCGTLDRKNVGGTYIDDA